MNDLLVENIQIALSKMCICMFAEDIRKMVKLDSLYGKKKSKYDVYAYRVNETVYLVYAEEENVISIKRIQLALV